MSSVTEKLAQRIADIVVSSFEQLEASGSRILVKGCNSPQQYIDGSLCKGTNALLASMCYSMMGYELPVWVTFNRLREWGVYPKEGEHGIPITNFKFYYTKKGSMEADPSMTDDVYEMLSPEEKLKWVKRCMVKTYPEFNLSQTNYREVYPDQWKESLELFNVAERDGSVCPELDSLIDTNGWVCPIVAAENATEVDYNLKYDVITCPPLKKVADKGRFYSQLVHAMSMSTGAELRSDRNLYSDKLSDRASEELLNELTSAIVSSVLGLDARIREENMSHIRAWINVANEQPSFIYSVMFKAKQISDDIVSHLSLQRTRGLDMDSILEGVDKAEEARELNRQRREKAAKAKKAYKGFKRGGRVRKAGAVKGI